MTTEKQPPATGRPPAGYMRATMPNVAQWVDDLRAAFGRDLIDGQIRAGVSGHAVFWAREGGVEIGTPPREDGSV